MKNYITHLYRSFTGKIKILKGFALAFFMVLSFLNASAQFTNVLCTGYNNDIVANGIGLSSIPGTTHPTINVDGARYCFVDNTYKYVSTNAFPTCFLPTNKLAASIRTPGLTYTLQDYTANNALTLDNDNTGSYTTSPFANTGTLTLSTAASYGKLFVLYETVRNIAPLTIDVIVTFTDATTQSFPGNVCNNWFDAIQPAFNGMGRTSPTGTMECGSSPNFFPNLFELQLAISPANYAKQVQSITFTM